MTKLTKKQSGFIKPPPQSLWSPHNKGIRCGTCVFYKDNKCKIVQGQIHPQACCNLWTHTGELNLDFSCGKDIQNMF